MLTVYMGWDSRETLAYDVAVASIQRRASVPVEIIPLKLHEPPVSELLTRSIEQRDGRMWCPVSQAPMATEFAVSRFCVPFIQREGWALFCDCDIVCLADIAELFALADDRFAVMCVKHEQPVAAGQTKMDGQVQTAYQRKNWSSVVLWNCGHPAHRRLTLGILNMLPGRDLHRFCWLEDTEIGNLWHKWNYLVGVDLYVTIEDGRPICQVDQPNNRPLEMWEFKGILHYTLGGPWLSGWVGGPLDDLWRRECESTRSLGAPIA